MHERIYSYVYNAAKAFFIKSRMIPKNHLSDNPTIYIANHEQSFGPVSAMASLPQPLYPWVTHEIVEPDVCPGYIENDFVRPEVHLRPPLSVLLSKVIGRICVAIMKDLGAIPVYKASRKIRETIEISVRYLEQGRRLLIFPEIPHTIFNDFLCEFDTGFISVAKRLYEKTRKIALFLPVAVHRGAQALKLGSPVRFNPLNSFHQEKQRIRREIVEQICEMYLSMEPQPDARREEDRVAALR